MVKARKVFGLLLLWAICLSASSQDVKVTGLIVDERDNPIELALIRVEGQATEFALSDLSGKFSFTCQREDSLVFICSMLGYRQKKHVVQNPADSIHINVVLSSLGRVLDEASVRAYRKQTETVLQIDPASAKLNPSTTGNAIEELIQMQMGVSTHNEMSSQYNVRGGNFDENCVYLNGIEVLRPMLISSGQQEGLSIINSNMVESINFSAGGFPAKYGDKMSSVLDIKYKRPEKFEASFALSLLGADAYVGFGNKKFSMMNGIRYKTTGYMLGSLDTNGEYSPNFFDYQNYTSWRPNENWSIDLIAYASINNYNFEPEDRETKYGTMADAREFTVYFDGEEKDAFNTLFGSLSITRNFGERTSVTLLGSLYKSKEEETYDIQGEYWLNEALTQEQLGVGTYMEHARNFLNSTVANVGLKAEHKTTRHTWEAGLNMQWQHVTENASEWEMRDSSDFSVPHSTETLALTYSLRAQTDVSTRRFEAYIQDTYRNHTSAGLLSINYGLRVSYWSWNEETLLSPRVSFGFVPAKNENWTFRFATGVYYQAPSYKEFRDTVTTNQTTVVKLNHDIKSQRSIHFLLGADYNFRMFDRPFKFTTELYYKALHNLIPYNVNNLRIVYYGENASSGYAAGIDFKLFGEFIPGTDAWITFSLMSTKEKIDGKSVPRPTDQRYAVNLSFTDYFPGTTRWKLTLRGVYADGLPFGVPHSSPSQNKFRAPAYKRVDIGMSYRLLDNEDRHVRSGLGSKLRNIWLGVDAFNILGINNVSSYYWITDITGNRNAIPNYLTGRLINARILVEI